MVWLGMFRRQPSRSPLALTTRPSHKVSAEGNGARLMPRVSALSWTLWKSHETILKKAGLEDESGDRRGGRPPRA